MQLIIEASGCMFRLLQVQMPESSSVTGTEGRCTNASSSRRLQCTPNSVQWHRITEGQALDLADDGEAYGPGMRIRFRADMRSLNLFSTM